MVAWPPMPSAPLDRSKTLTRVIFASCAQQNEDQSIWDVIANEAPDLTRAAALVGTPLYMAQELIAAPSGYSAASALYSTYALLALARAVQLVVIAAAVAATPQPCRKRRRSTA